MAHPPIPWDAAVLLGLIFATPVFCLLIVASVLSYRIARKWKRIPPDKRTWVERPWIAWPAAGFLLLYGLCFAYACLIESHWVQTTTTEIKVTQPVLGYDHFRIVHLSDLHLERIGRREERMIEQVRAAKPHLILLTGDYLNVREGANALHEILGALEAPHGVYGVEGNWDMKFIVPDVFRRRKVPYLLDDSTLLERNGQRLRIVGQSLIPTRPLRDLLPLADDGAWTIYLHHLPDMVDEVVARGPHQRVDLFLCGHTHGGQVRLPFWGAVITLSKYHKRYECGRYEVDGIPMIVSRGIGSGGGGAPPVRFLARPEVGVIDLVYR